MRTYIRAFQDFVIALALGAIIGGLISAGLSFTFPYQAKAVLATMPPDDNGLLSWCKTQPNVIDPEVIREGDFLILKYQRKGVISKYLHPPWKDLGYGYLRSTTLERQFLPAHFGSLDLLVMILSSQAGFLLVGFIRWYLTLRKKEREWLAAKPSIYSALLRSIAVSGILLGLGIIYDLVMKSLLHIDYISAGPWLELRNFAITAQVIMIGLGSVVVPFCEELFFRQAIYGSFLAAGKPNAGILLSSLMFALAHLDPVNLAVYFVFGLLLAWLYKRTGSIVWPAIAHGINNCVAFVLIIYGN